MQRVAHELVAALDRNVSGADFRFRLVHPASVRQPPLRTIDCEALTGPSGALWEQTALAWRSRGNVLLNLANTAPLAHRRSIVMIHDAQVFESPRSYSRAFRGWYRFLLPRIAARSLALLTVSEHSARGLAAFGVRAPHGARVVSNGLDHVLRAEADAGALSRHGLAPQGYVLSFASTQAHKNVGFLAALFTDARLAGIQLALVGERMPAETPVPPNARLLGPVGDGALRALYANAACFAFPSLTEGFGLPPGEAMLCGAPAVVSDVGAMNEVYRDGAWLVPPGDREAWIAAIRTLTQDRERRALWAGKGQACAHRLGWDAAGRKLLEEVGAALGDLRH